MEFINENLELISTIGSICNLLTVGALYIYMHLTRQSKGKKLTISWYIFGFLFPIITYFVFVSKNKKDTIESYKLCPTCGERCPADHIVCGKCAAALPDEAVAPVIVKTSPKAITASLVAFFLFFAATVAFEGVSVYSIATDLFSELVDYDDEIPSYRIGFENEEGLTVYYDMMGNTYQDPNEVIIYDRDGGKYTYTEESIFEFYYIDEKGEKFDYYYCYVDSDGYFYYDTEDEIFIDESWWDGDDFDEEYFYYEYKYFDEEGNVYYDAMEASWNEKGELITEENDVNK